MMATPKVTTAMQNFAISSFLCDNFSILLQLKEKEKQRCQHTPLCQRWWWGGGGGVAWGKGLQQPMPKLPVAMAMCTLK
jgi:hypothetical protein